MQTFKESRLAGWIALAVSLAGLMTHPDILNLLPEKYAISVSAAGMILQAITKRVALYAK